MGYLSGSTKSCRTSSSRRIGGSRSGSRSSSRRSERMEVVAVLVVVYMKKGTFIVFV